jgi:hypothetical protein
MAKSQKYGVEGEEFADSANFWDNAIKKRQKYTTVVATQIVLWVVTTIEA